MRRQGILWRFLLLVICLAPTLLHAQFSNRSLSGRYVYSYSGYDVDGAFVIAGMLTADGNGRITSGVFDQNGSGQILVVNESFTGTYNIGADGRGRATLTSGVGSSNISFVMVSNDQARFILFDGSSVGAGLIERQTGTTFANSSLNGSYSFLFEGGPEGGWTAAVGRFTADGAGSISNGVEDLNDTGFVANATFSGNYNIEGNSRGTARLNSTLGAANFAFYVMSPTRVKFIAVDRGAGVFGDAEKHDRASFSNAVLSGGYALLSRGLVIEGWDVVAGRLTANGAGVISDGILDENAGGAFFGGVPFTGNYAMSADGRAIAALATPFGIARYAIYAVSADKAFFVTLDDTAATGGVLEAQKGGPFDSPAFSGTYAFNSDGVSDIYPVATVGTLAANEQRAVNFVEDLNLAGDLQSALTASGSFSLSANGRGVLSTNVGVTSNIRFYVVSPSRVFWIQTDDFAAMRGIAEKQISGVPVVPPNAVVNGASFAAGQAVAAGGIASLFGTNLAAGSVAAGSVPLPTTLGGVTVRLNGTAVPLFYVSPSQINFQIPWQISGNFATIQVTREGIDSEPQTVNLGAGSAGIFTVNAAGYGAILIANTDVLVAPAGSIPGRTSRAVSRGDYVSIYCTGLGPVSDPPPAGSPASGTTLSHTSFVPTVTVGGVPANVDFSGLAPGFVALYQVNVQIPAGAPTGDAVNVVMTVAGSQSNVARIALQ